ncbi:MAG: right-handed parallel beta-helix repeat-containing protein, partial [candidate division Zixibacteria bacterium]|nr:right-handed parallel beta-helix repeat-containing protein [candidate division Zixibacteria bacterium]
TYPAHDVTGNSFINNGMAVIVDGAFASTLDAEENYWGTLSCPVVASNVTGPVDYEPWCNSDFSFCGFACSLAEVWVDDDWVGTAEGTNVGGHIFGYDAFDVIADGVNAVSDAGTVHVFDGNYDIPINIDSRTGVSILGESEAGTIFKPATTLDWGFAPYGAGRQAAIRVFGSTGVTLSNMTMDFDLIKADNVFGLLMWNSAGEISNNTLQNMNTAGYYEFISYLRAPDYTDGARAQIDILNNTFLKTGRVAVVVHDYVNTLIEGNNFDMVVDDFGYAIELGSAATGTIRGNTFTNYDTWAATDQSTVSAIYVENSFTMGVVDPISKPVVIEGNEISNCQYGIIVGNEVPGYAGNVDIVVTIEENNIHDNSTSGSLTSGAILLTDEGKDAGSSINATVHDNIIYNNGDYGLLINTDGNGDISSTLTENIFAENYTGVSIKDYATTSTSSYSMIVHHNFFDNFLNAEDDVVGGYWDDLTTNEGNCWSDWETNIGYPLHYTISGNADARDRKPNRANCDGMGECETGEANGEAPINILDIVYLINFKYKEGPDPIPYALCSGDPNCDCEINILDIVYLINFKYKEGPAPCGGSDWMFACKLPIRGETPADAVVSINPINEEISAKTAVSKDQINEKTLEIPVVSNELINDTKKANSFSAFK